MSADDKCKLDAMLGTRLGVLGFSGAGMPDDGGWLSGDIILAAGTEFISLERIGMQVKSLNSLEALDMLYSFYSPSQAKSQPLTNQTVKLLEGAFL
jgi:hypothetical protein